MKLCIHKLEIFTNFKRKFHVIWNLSKFQSLFNNKDVSHYSSVILRSVLV